MPRPFLLAIVALMGASACGQTRHDAPLAATTGGAAGRAGGGAGGASTGNVNPGGAGGLAAASGASGASGASATLAAVAECEHYCDTLSYRLPTALCEDWNRPGWEPEFCGQGYTPSCTADHCSNVYAVVSPACAATLPAVIRCVAPTYATITVPSASECWLGDCRHLLYSMTSACYGLREKLTAARALWATSGVVDYRLQYDWNGATAQVVVRAGSAPTVTPVDAVAWTVPMLFDEVERYLNEPGVAPGAQYDPELGYVIVVARLEGCDEEPRIGVSGVEVAPLR